MEDISGYVGNWDDYQEAFNAALNSDTGKIFAENFTIGADQTTKINKLIEILVGMQERIQTLITDTYSFCEAQRRANAGEDDN